MNFTFGLATEYTDLSRISEIISSIRRLNIPRYEIISVSGRDDIEPIPGVRNIYLHDPSGRGWITKKKNIMAQEAAYDNIVLFHDYYVFDTNWYINYLTFGDNWDVCSNAQYLINGLRHFTDWVTWDSPIYPRYTSLDYYDWSHTKYMYQSGGYMLVKKHFMLQYPMNENLYWGMSEDVEWSLRIRDFAKWKCNGGSVVYHNKRHRDVI